MKTGKSLQPKQVEALEPKASPTTTTTTTTPATLAKARTRAHGGRFCSKTPAWGGHTNAGGLKISEESRERREEAVEERRGVATSTIAPAKEGSREAQRKVM
jgi:hypothetical protein